MENKKEETLITYLVKKVDKHSVSIGLLSVFTIFTAWSLCEHDKKIKVLTKEIEDLKNEEG